MKRVKGLSLLAAAILLAGNVLVGGCKHTEADEHGSKMATYTCPHHPEVAQSSPGTCPKCGMTLVRKE